MDYKQEYTKWKEDPRVDSALKTELMSVTDEAEIEDRFFTLLEFGTAGLRGIIGAGTNRMNLHVVNQATKGLCDYLLEKCDAPAVAIAYDSRNMSREFAKSAACVLAHNGVKVFLYETLHSVPQLSFTVRHLKLNAGIVITASHNPPKYNGFKVYGACGGQLDVEDSLAVTSKIRATDMFAVELADYDKAVSDGTITLIGKELDEKYYSALMSLLHHPELTGAQRSSIKVVYTPLHGAGLVPVTEMLQRMGIVNTFVVEEQKQPNGDFPTVKSPNPEEPSAFELARKLAKKKDADVILATDPDSDRLGVAIKHECEYELLTGNQIGSLLLYYVLSSMKNAGTLPANALAIKSIVSTKLVDAICKDYSVMLCEVLTGFRFIAEKIHDLTDGENAPNSFIFGFEESYGFLRGSFVRDKDAVIAACLITEAAAYYNSQGLTLYEVLESIYDKYGFYFERAKSYTCTGKTGMEQIADVMASLRKTPPTELYGKRIIAISDYDAQKITNTADKSSEPIALSRSNVLKYELEDGSWVCARPSGTEPKLKLYIGAKGNDRAEAQATAAALLEAVAAPIDKILNKN